MSQFDEILRELKTLDLSRLYRGDFFHTWDKSDQEIAGVFAVADALRDLRGRNLSPRVFDSGLALSLAWGGAPRDSLPFAAACDLLGLTLRDLEGEALRPGPGRDPWEGADGLPCLTDVIGVRDPWRAGGTGEGMEALAAAVEAAARAGLLEQRPTLVNLQSGLDHPVQALSGALSLIHRFGGVDQLRGKKVALAWVRTPGPAQPLGLPQGLAGLLTRFGMDVVLAHPQGYGLLPQAEEAAQANARRSGGSYRQVASLDEAFEGADILCPLSWAPQEALDRRAQLQAQGDAAGLRALEERLAAQGAAQEGWDCTGDRLARTRGGKGLSLCPLPAGTAGREGEEAGAWRQAAGFQPYLLAAMIFLAQCPRPVEMLRGLEQRGRARKKP